MIRKPSTWLPLIFGVILILGISYPTDAYALSPRQIKEALMKLLEGTNKSAPKHADELPPLRVKPKSVEEGLGLNGPLITKSLARATHHKTCPSMKLRVSLPQLNVSIGTVSKNINIRSGPDIYSQVQAQYNEPGTYIVDLLKTHKCWIQVRYIDGDGQKRAGWVYSKYFSFEFDNHLTKPQKRLTQNLGTDGVYELVARSTYKVITKTAQGTAVAVSPTVLLTNCHVLDGHEFVQILENGSDYEAVLIHDDYSEDQCFIRSLFLEVRPVPNVQGVEMIQKGERAYTIGAPLGFNRSIGEGVVFDGRQLNGVMWIDATAQVEPGSSGGGLFDDKGNLLGITTRKVTEFSGHTYSRSIAAEDFWR